MTHEEQNEAKTGMIIAYGIAGCIIMQKPFRECLNWYGVDPNGEGIRTFKESYPDQRLFLLVSARVINKCNLWAELSLESYPTIDTSVVLLLTGKYRDEFRRISPGEREDMEISPEWAGVREYIQEILEDYYVFREIRTIKIISGPSQPEATLYGRNSIHNAIYEVREETKIPIEPKEADTPKEVSPSAKGAYQTLGESFSDMVLNIGKLHIACLELSIRFLGSGLRFLFGIR